MCSAMMHVYIHFASYKCVHLFMSHALKKLVSGGEWVFAKKALLTNMSTFILDVSLKQKQ